MSHQFSAFFSVLGKKEYWKYTFPWYQGITKRRLAIVGVIACVIVTIGLLLGGLNLAISMLSILELLVYTIIIVVVFVLMVKLGNYQKYIWQQYAKKKNWTYAEKGDPNAEKWLIYRHGQSSLTNVLVGTIDNRPLRIQTYTYRVTLGDTTTTYVYTSYTVRFLGHFPHIYLDHRGNGFGVQVGVRLSVPEEFGQRFFLYAPKKYEIEALAIFTPEVYAKLLDAPSATDLELYDQEMCLYISQYVLDQATIDKQLTIVRDVVAILSKNLDSARYTEIPQHPPTL